LGCGGFGVGSGGAVAVDEGPLEELDVGAALGAGAAELEAEGTSAVVAPEVEATGSETLALDDGIRAVGSMGAGP
jgi:hypothetical protein